MMTMFKKFSLCLIATVISSYAYAGIIELDAANPDHCRQQILKSADELPVIAAYSTDWNDGDVEFMKKFEALAKAHPERTFYKWDAQKDMLHVTRTLCLQQLGVPVIPSITMLGVFKDDITSETFMSSPLRLSWAGEMTMAELTKFIDVSEPSVKKFISLQRNRRYK